MRSLIAAALVSLAAAPVFAQSPVGLWLRDNGNSRVRIAPCGDSLCGTLAWVKEEGKAQVGQRIFYNMKENGPNSWTGNAFNPEDGKTYSGKMSLSGNMLTTAGCALGGIVCRSVSWKRVN